MTHFTPFTHNFLQSILSSIDSKDPVVANAWLDTLLDVIDLLPVDVLGKEVLGIAVNKSQSFQPTFSKLGACQLIGKLAMKLEHQMVLAELVPIAQSLIHDAEWSIRASVCTQLLMLAKGLSNNGVNQLDKASVSVLLSMLVELSGDEEEAVRLVAVETSSSILHLLDKECITMVMVPLLRKMSGALKSEDKTLPLLALHWSRICRAVQDHLSPQDKQWFVDFYYQMASLGTSQQTKVDKPHMPDVVADTDSGPKLEIYAEVRHACAASCASMVAFIGAEQFACNINTLRILAADPHFVVRRAVAANLLELCRQLDHHAKVIHPIWNLLLNDPFNDVTCALVPQVGAIIELLTRLGPHSPFAEESVVVETCEAVLRCEEQVMNCSSWRLQADMLSQLAALPLCLPCNAVHDLLIPRLWHRIETSRPLPCRIAAAQTLMLCVRSERRRQERSTLCSNIVTKLILAASCHLRMLFLRVCPILFDLLSRKFFRQHFFTAVVRLADDKVPNVRLRFCSLLPHLHTSLRGLDLETEKRLIVQLDSAVRRLVETEKDRDVKEELTKFFGWIEQQEKKGPRITDEDAQDDRRKEEQENQWDLADERQQSHQTAASGESLRLPFFVSVQETHEPDANEPQPPEPAQGQRTESLDPSTDEFYRDAGVRLSPAGETSRSLAKNATQSTPAAPVTTSRIPSIQIQRRTWADKADGPPFVQSRLKLPTAVSSKQQSTVPQFGIARTSQHVQPKPSMAYGVSAPSPSLAGRVQRRSLGSALSPSSKSRSQENLNFPAKPRVARPISACLGADFNSANANKSNFTRNRFRASIGSVPSRSASSGIAPPIATLPPRSSESKAPDSRLSAIVRKAEMAVKGYATGIGKNGEVGSVKLSDMKSALPTTPFMSRKLPGAAPPPALKDASSSSGGMDQVQPTYARRVNPVNRNLVSVGERPAAPTGEGRLEQAAAELLAVLQSTHAPNNRFTRLRRPAVTSMRPSTALPVTPLPTSAASNSPAKTETAGSGSCPNSPQNSRSSSPEPTFQRRTQWRRSVHFISTNNSATTHGITPPPPPPRKSFGTLPHSRNNGNNNNNNNNNLASNGNSKLPVPASSARHSTDLGSNF